MGGLEKILERIPYASGTLRRRLISGVIVAGVGILGIVSPLAHSDVLGKLADEKTGVSTLVKSTQAMFLVLLLVYALGALVDVISDGFVVRGVSVVANLVGGLPTSLMFASFVLWPLFLTYGIIYSTYRRKPYKLDLGSKDLKDFDIREALSSSASKYYSHLPETLRTGFNEPFGGKSDAAWQAAVHLVPEAHRSWVASLHARNHEVSSFLSAAFLGTVACLIAGVVREPGEHYETLALLYVVLCFVSYLFLGYTSIVRRSAASVIEFLTFISAVAPESKVPADASVIGLAEKADSAASAGSEASLANGDE